MQQTSPGLSSSLTVQNFACLWLCGALLAVATGFFTPDAAHAQSGHELARTIASTDSRGDIRGLTKYIRANFAADTVLAEALAGHLASGAGWFDRNGAHGDSIDNVTTNGALVILNHRRNGKRLGQSQLIAHRIGDGLVVLAGEWWQPRKMRGSSPTTPPIPLPNGEVIPPVTIPGGYQPYWGEAVYVFEKTSIGFRSVSGTGMDFGDSKTNPKWLIGSNGR